MRRRPLTALVSLVLVTGLLRAPSTAGAREALDLDGTSWSFLAAIARTKARASGLGAMRQRGGEDVVVSLLPGETWRADVGSALVLGGTFSRENELARRLLLTLDTPSAEALAALYVGAIEAGAAQEGVDLNVALAVERSAIVLVVRPKKRTGMATAKLTAKFVLVGTVTVPGAGSVPGKVRATLRGTSLPLLLGPSA